MTVRMDTSATSGSARMMPTTFGGGGLLPDCLAVALPPAGAVTQAIQVHRDNRLLQAASMSSSTHRMASSNRLLMLAMPIIDQGCISAYTATAQPTRRSQHTHCIVGGGVQAFLLLDHSWAGHNATAVPRPSPRRFNT